MTRSEHLQWAKDRALEYLDSGDLTNAFTSMMSDLSKHDELKGHAGGTLGLMLKFAGNLRTDRDIREWINGFN